MLYISNAFALSMLPRTRREQQPKIQMLSEADLDEFVQTDKSWGRLSEGHVFTSAIGHTDMAALVSARLGIVVPVNRVSIQLQPGDTLLVAQYSGPRLPEGVTTLPEGAEITYWVVEIPQKLAFA